MRCVASVMSWLVLLTVGCDRSDSNPESANQPAGDSPVSGPATEPAQGPAAAAVSNEPAQALEFIAPTLTREQIEDGWVSLFDGKTLFGWQANHGEHDWEVVDGAIRSESAHPGLLLTTIRLSDFELRCDFRLEPGGNSGLFLRTLAEPADPAVDCYELNICDSHPAFPTGSLVARQRVADSYPCEGEWHTYHVRVDGGNIRVQLDDRPILDFTEPPERLRKIGFLGLQANGGRIEFRNVHLRPLNTRPLFNGTDLTGWTVVPDSQGVFDVDAGTIQATGGPGYLQTQDIFDDFTLQFDVRTEGEGLNSGVFFRAEPGTAEAPANGYELQICNQFADGDRSRPNEYGTGFGTGAIFRRQKARWVVSDDRKWCSLTLIADGPRFATWVDGYPVVVWTDDRQPNPNARRGLSLAAGHLSLQGHDPTTKIRFRNLRIQSLP